MSCWQLIPTITGILSYSIYSMHAVNCILPYWPCSGVCWGTHLYWSCQPATLCLVPLSPPVKCQCHRALELLSVEDSVKYVYGIDFQLSPALLALLRCQLRKTLVLPASNLVSGAPVNVIGHQQFASACWRECFVYASTIDCQIQFLTMLNPGCVFFGRGLEVLHKV